jgi:hypothetical protein
MSNIWEDRDPVGEVGDLLESEKTLGDAMKLYVEHNLTVNLNTYARILVTSPENLQIYLDRVERLYTDDFQAMMSRCIEKSHSESLDLLLKFASSGRLVDWRTEQQVSTVRLKLLPEKYSINTELYQRAKNAGFSDPWVEGSTDPYPGSESAEKAAHQRYTGYRDAYHCFLYGSKSQWQIFLDLWDTGEWDCTMSAAEDFLLHRIPGFVENQPSLTIQHMKSF